MALLNTNKTGLFNTMAKPPMPTPQNMNMPRPAMQNTQSTGGILNRVGGAFPLGQTPTAPISGFNNINPQILQMLMRSNPQLLQMLMQGGK